MFEEKKPNSTRSNVTEKLLLSFVRQQKSTKRWMISFRILFFAWLFVFTGILFRWFDPADIPFLKSDESPYTAVIHLKGVIGEEESAKAGSVITSLKKASEDERAKAIILAIDSPGGSAVHSGRIYDEIMSLRKQHPDKHIYSVINEMGTSGAYYIASASEKIYANRASFIGSIGAYIAGYDVTFAAQKLGISRRIYKAGYNKIFMDPFLPDTPETIKNAERNVEQIHKQFIDCVKAGRGSRLNTHYPGLFSGLSWTGEDALQIGLIDGLGDVQYVAEKIVGVKEQVDFTYQADIFQGVLHKLSLSVADTIKPLLKTWLSSSGRAMS